MIPFNKPLITGNERKYLDQVLSGTRFCGGGSYNKMCQEWAKTHWQAQEALLITSCTHALEMAALLANIQPGDEVIMPSYTFVSTANAFVLRGAKIVFVDIHPETMNLNENLIEQAITSKTKAIVPVHYAGVACEMEKILAIAAKHKLWVIEDAAQGVMATYRGRYLGTIGQLGAYSFHETKNYHCGEGGMLLVNSPEQVARAEVIREKGTDRSRFLRGEIDKYTWVDLGSSYITSELNAAFLYGQLHDMDKVTVKRLELWNRYRDNLGKLEVKGCLELTKIPQYCQHNAHMFFIKTAHVDERHRLIEHLKSCGIHATFHYIPLHSTKAGLQWGRFVGEDVYTTRESERLLRLPLFYELTLDQVDFISDAVMKFYL